MRNIVSGTEQVPFHVERCTLLASRVETMNKVTDVPYIETDTQR